jgi:CheY-like chemotaxis protein
MEQNQSGIEPSAEWLSATVMVVEDDPVCLRIITRALEDRGYKILSATSGQAALKLSYEYLEKIDLLFTDFFMPGLNGRELALRIQRLRPGIKILYMTGYMNRLIHVASSLDGWSEDILAKPIPPETLDEVIQASLKNTPKAGC